MTDLPDAVVEAAAEGAWRGGNPDAVVTWAELDPFAQSIWRDRARAALAAASGPWAEQLDAELRADLEVQQKQNKELAAERDQALLRLKRIIELEPVAHAAEQIRESDGSFTTQVAGVRLEKCDEYGRTKTTAERDAALARNAELQGKRSAAREVVTGLVQASESSVLAELQKWHAKCDEVGVPHDPDGLVRHHRNNEAATQGAWKLTAQEAIAQNETLRAELDNLRDRVNALADQYEKDADESDNYGGELWSTTSAALRAIVRGSDDA